MTRTRATYSLLIFGLGLGRAAGAAVTNFTTTGLTLGIDDNGKVVSFLDTVTGVQRASQISTYQQSLCQVSYGGQIVNPTSCLKVGGLMTYTFGTISPLTTVAVRVTQNSSYLEVSCDAVVSTAPLDYVRFCNINALGSLDGALYRFMRYSDNGHQRYACITPLDQWTMTTVLPGTGGSFLWGVAYPNLVNPIPISLPGRKVAVFTCEATQAGFFAAMQTIDTDYSLMQGVSTKQLPAQKKSEIFWMGGQGAFTYGEKDEVLQYTLNMAAGRMLIHDKLWGDQYNAWVVSPTWGTIANLHAWISQCQTAGLKVGAHMLVGSVLKNSTPYILGGCDSRIARDRSVTLAVTFDNSLTTGLIQTTTAPLGWPTNTGDRDLVVDNEIIQYTSLKTDAPPYGFQGPFVRHKNQGITPLPHQAGVAVQRLVNTDGDWGYEWDCGSTNGIGQNATDISTTLNQAGFDYVYADQLVENTMNLGPGAYGDDLQVTSIINALNPKPQFVESASETGGFAWQYLGMDGQIDYGNIETNGIKSEVDRNIGLISGATSTNTFLTHQIGWVELFNPTSPYVTQLDDIEYLYAKSIAWDYPVTLQVWFDAFKAAPNRDAIFAMMQKYESLRQSAYFNVMVKNVARTPGKDFLLITDETNTSYLTPATLMVLAGGNSKLRGFLTDSSINGSRWASIWTTDGLGHAIVLDGVTANQVVARDYHGNVVEAVQSATGVLRVPVNGRLFIKLVNVSNINGLFANALLQ